MSTMSSPVVLGAGPVGRAVVASLASLGHRPRIITRSGTEVVGADSVIADLYDPVAAKAAVAGADVIFHCAQPHYHRWAEDFPPLQRSILTAAEGTEAVVVAVDNLYGYGQVDGPIHEGLPMNPCSRKGRVRAALGAELAAAHAEGRVRTAAVRASDFFGPHVRDSSYGEQFFGRLIKGAKAEVLGSPEALHSATFVPDIASAMVAVAGRPDTWGRAWHAPTAPAVPQTRLVELAAEAAGTTASFTKVVPWQLRLAGLFIKGARETVEMLYEFESDFVIDSSAIETELGISPTPLVESLALAVEWFSELESAT